MQAGFVFPRGDLALLKLLQTRGGENGSRRSKKKKKKAFFAYFDRGKNVTNGKEEFDRLQGRF